MCERSGESIDHLLLHCELRTKLFVSSCCEGMVSELLVSWRGQLGHRIALKMWRLAVLSLMGCISREWNARSFEDRETVMLELKKMIFHSPYTWRVA